MRTHFEERTAAGVVDAVRMKEVVAIDVVHKADVAAAAAVVVECRIEVLVAVVGRTSTVEVEHRTHGWQDMELARG